MQPIFKPWGLEHKLEKIPRSLSALGIECMQHGMHQDCAVCHCCPSSCSRNTIDTSWYSEQFCSCIYCNCSTPGRQTAVSPNRWQHWPDQCHFKQLMAMLIANTQIQIDKHKYININTYTKLADQCHFYERKFQRYPEMKTDCYKDNLQHMCNRGRCGGNIKQHVALVSSYWIHVGPTNSEYKQRWMQDH